MMLWFRRLTIVFLCLAMVSIEAVIVNSVEDINQDFQNSEEQTATENFYDSGIAPHTLYTDGVSLVNVALNKNVTSSGTHNTTQYYEARLVDGSEGTSATHCTLVSGNANGRSYLLIDLGNYYDVKNFEWVTRYSSSLESNYNNVEIAGSAEFIEPSSFHNQMTQLYTITSSEFQNDNNSTFRMIAPTTGKKFRYIAIYRDNVSSFFGAAEFRVFAQTNEEFGKWTVTKDNTSIDKLNGSGTYGFSLPVTSHINQDVEYVIVLCAYDSDGFLLNAVYKDVVSTGKQSVLLTSQITIDDNTKKMTCFIIKSLNYAFACADSIDLE